MVFIHPDPVEFRVAQLRCKALPDDDGQVLRGRNARREFWHLFIEEAVVHCVQDLATHDLLELLEINHKTRPRIDFTFHSYLEEVVMTVSVGVVALSEQALVLLRGQIRVVIIV